MSARACILGCAGPELRPEERAFFADARPWGFILFARNCRTPEQMRRLCGSLRDAVGREAPILIDEEGGRVSRLRALAGYSGPPAAVFAQAGLSEDDMQNAVRANYRAIGARLAALGVDVDCAPVLDLPAADADPVIGDRAFSRKAKEAARLGRACLEGLEAAGVSGVIKHVPGHGRAKVDSHKALPRISASAEALGAHDFLPFAALKDAAMAMTGHVVYEAFDPQNPATESQIVIHEVIRGRIGFDGLLMSDDLDMKALAGRLGERAARALRAGCDVVLQCNGDLDSMAEVAGAVPLLAGKALQRAHAARRRAAATRIDPAQAAAEAESWLARLPGGAP